MYLRLTTLDFRLRGNDGGAEMTGGGAAKTGYRS